MIIIVVIIIIHHPHRERERERERGTGDRTRRDKKTRSRKEKDLLLLWFMAAAALVVGGNATSGFTSISSAGAGGGSLASAILPWAVALVALLLLLEQLSYLRKKGPLPGPALVVPLLGSAVPMILDPTSYWRRLAAAASTRGLSADYLLGRFVVFLRSADLSHAVFANVRPDAFQVIGHPFGRKLFGDHNLIYMFGQQHKDLRRRIAPNFTPRALATYLHLQQSIVFSHIHRWIQISHSDDTSIPLRLLCRDMNLDTSQTVFAGPYLSPEARAAFNRDYNHFNVGLMALPVDLPGFAFRGARLAVSRLVSTLAGSVAESKRRMSSADAEPTCLVDFWMQETLREMAEAERAGAPPPPESGDREIGGHLFDFLFASQDASTSSLLWAVALLESHPEVLARVRAEVSSLWSPAEDDGRWPAITAEMLRGMRYTEAVAREVIRYRPPATLVPHVAAEEVELPGAGGYRVPKGAIVFPSLLEASFQGFSHPDRFDPDRFSDQRQEDRVHRKNFLAFGAGAHQCLGQRYALNHLILFIAAFVSLVDFKRHRTNGCDEIAYVPTIAPRDDCRVYLSPRTTRFPDF